MLRQDFPKGHVIQYTQRPRVCASASGKASADCALYRHQVEAATAYSRAASTKRRVQVRYLLHYH